MPDDSAITRDEDLRDAAEHAALKDRFISPAALPTAREREILDIIQEECAEIIHRAAKAKRFGLEEVQPGQPWPNKQRLSFEIGDLLGVLDLARMEGLILDKHVMRTRAGKMGKLAEFMQTQPETEKESEDGD